MRSANIAGSRDWCAVGIVIQASSLWKIKPNHRLEACAAKSLHFQFGERIVQSAGLRFVRNGHFVFRGGGMGWLMIVRRRRRTGFGLMRIFGALVARQRADRSEEHTSELQSRQYLVCRLL